MTRLDHVRAALIAVVLLANAIYALPLPPALSEKELRTNGLEDLDHWVAILGAVGVHLTRDELVDDVVRTTAAIHKVHLAAKAPFKPLFDLLGADQSWALFSSATVRPDRLEVQAQREGSDAWETLFRRLDPCCTWHAGQLEFRRVRGVWDGQTTMRPAYKGLTPWIAAQVFAERPDVVRVRVRLLRGKLTYPWEERDPEEQPVLVRVHERPAPAEPSP